MRKISAIITVLILLFLPLPAIADDVPPYVRVLTNDVYLYATASNTKPMFALEQTYYAEVKGVEGGYYRVEIADNVGMFNKITGYVLISKVEAVYETPLTPFYPSVTVSVTADSSKIYLYPESTSTVLMRATNSQIMAYYGSIVTGGINWYYVCCGDYMGYVMSSTVSKAAVSPHPTPLPAVNIEPEDPVIPVDNVEDPSADNTDDVTQSFDGVQLALILLITIPSVVIVFMLFAPSHKGVKKHEKQNYKSVATTTQTAEEKRPKPRYFDDYL